MRSIRALVLLAALTVILASNSAWAEETVQIVGNVEPAEGGSIEGIGAYRYGMLVTLYALENPGYLFSHWRSSDTAYNESTKNPLYFYAYKNVEFTALFDTISSANQTDEYVQLVVRANVTEVEIPHNNHVRRGESVTLVAPVSVALTADVRYTFVGWSGDASGTEPRIIVHMDGSKVLEAQYIREIRFVDGVWYSESICSRVAASPTQVSPTERLDLRGWMIPSLNTSVRPTDSSTLIPTKFIPEIQPITAKQYLVTFVVKGIQSISLTVYVDDTPLDLESTNGSAALWVDEGSHVSVKLPEETDSHRLIGKSKIMFTANEPQTITATYEPVTALRTLLSLLTGPLIADAPQTAPLVLIVVVTGAGLAAYFVRVAVRRRGRPLEGGYVQETEEPYHSASIESQKFSRFWRERMTMKPDESDVHLIPPDWFAQASESTKDLGETVTQRQEVIPGAVSQPTVEEVTPTMEEVQPTPETEVAEPSIEAEPKVERAVEEPRRRPGAADLFKALKKGRTEGGVQRFTLKDLEAASLADDTPNAMRKALNEGYAYLDLPRNARPFLRREKELMQSVAHALARGKSIVLAAPEGSGKRTLLEKALQTSGIKYVSATPEKGRLPTLLQDLLPKEVLDQIKPSWKGRGRYSAEDQLAVIPLLVDTGYRYVVIYDIDQLDIGEIDRLVKACFAARGLGVAATSREALPIDGFETVELKPYTVKDLRWIALTYSAVKGIVLDEKAEHWLAEYAAEHESADTVVSLMTYLEGATLADVQAAVKHREAERREAIIHGFTPAEEKTYKWFVEKGGTASIQELKEHFMTESKQLRCPSTNWAFRTFREKMKSLGFRYHQLVKKGKGLQEEPTFEEKLLRRRVD